MVADSPARIDLHAHSSYSDGTDTPAELIAQAAAAGLTMLALTDHDTTAGWDEASDAARRHGLPLVLGEEVSTSIGGRSVHMLAYLHDRAFLPLRRTAEGARRSRRDRARRMVELIGQDYPITWDDVLDQAGSAAESGSTLGRPHIADALVAAGSVRSRSEAFDTVLSGRSGYYIPYDVPDTLQTIRAIRDAGGVPVVAHPRARGSRCGDDVLTEMIGAGLLGIEVDHREQDGPTRADLSHFVVEHDLIPTGSSDFHGEGKPNRLGENLTPPESVARIEAAATSGLEIVR